MLVQIPEMELKWPLSVCDLDIDEPKTPPNHEILLKMTLQLSARLKLVLNDSGSNAPASKCCYFFNLL